MWLNYSSEQMKHARLSKILFNVTNINYLFRIYKQPMLDRADIRPPKCGWKVDGYCWNKPKMAYSCDLPKMEVWHYGLKFQWYLTGDIDERYGMVFYGLVWYGFVGMVGGWGS